MDTAEMIIEDYYFNSAQKALETYYGRIYDYRVAECS